VRPEGWPRPASSRGEEWTQSDGAKVTENPGKPEGVIAIANALPDMGALSQFIFSGDENDNTVTMTTEMTDANFSKKLKSYEAHIVAAFLPKCT
jgi:hypothetical protein